MVLAVKEWTPLFDAQLPLGYGFLGCELGKGVVVEYHTVLQDFDEGRSPVNRGASQDFGEMLA